jgi:subtilase family serine protease
MTTSMLRNLRQVTRAISSLSLLAVLAVPYASAQSPSAQAPTADSASAAPFATPRVRVTQAVDENDMVALPGRIHPQAKPSNDRGLVSDAQLITRIHLVLQRSAEQQAALTQLMSDQQNATSPNYHAWLTPQSFGKQFGPADADVAAVTGWLASQGFQNIQVSNGRTTVEFSGNVGQVRRAFRTEIHKFFAGGEEHFANVSAPQIPAALAPVITGVASLHNFHSHPLLHRIGKFRKDMRTGVTQPLFTFTDVNGTFYGVGPGDFAKIYNVPSANTGAGRSIAIVARSNINTQDVCDFRTMFGLLPACPAYIAPGGNLQIITNGEDPGLVSGDEGESDLDVEWAGAVAPGATIKFVTTESTQTDGVDGVGASGFYIVNNNVADILSQSYGSCEIGAGADNADQNFLWEQAAAQGITVVVAAGDNGAANCDDENSESTAEEGNAVSGAASTPFDTAVGGTDFDDVTTQTTFWNPATLNTPNTNASAKGYIPEVPWNDSCGFTGITGCTAASANLNLIAGSGGQSAVYNIPSYQSAFGITDTTRDLPDVSFFAGDGKAGSFYIVCESDENIPGDDGCNLTTFSTTSPFHDFQAVGGTSGAAPAFAGVMALVDAKTGQRQGVANYVLYSLAKTETFSSCNSSATPAANCIFNDITKGNNAVACAGGAPDCSNKTSGGIGVETTLTGGSVVAFAATTGYDLATGLGSLNVTNLVNAWISPSRIATTTTLSGPSSATLNSTVKYTGTLSKASGSAAPTGFVELVDTQSGVIVDVATLSGTGTSYSISTPFLPAGNYNLEAHYGGDGVYAASDSTSIAITVAKAASTLAVSFVTFDVNGNPILSTAAQSLPYGNPYILRVDVNTPAGSCATVAVVCPTGTIQLFKNTGIPLNDFPKGAAVGATNIATVNDRGFVEDQPIQLPVGSYSISATYTAATNSSYTSNNASNAVAVIISQASTTTAVTPNVGSVTAGGSVTLTAIVASQSNSSVGPTGSVQFKNGTTTIGAAVTCTPTGFNATTNVGAFCTATATTTASFLNAPAGDSNKSPFQMPALRTGPLFATAVALLLLFLLGLTQVPAEKRRRHACAAVLLLACAVGGLAGCGGGGGGSGPTGHTDTFSAVYSGDNNYATSTSANVTISVQ